MTHRRERLALIIIGLFVPPLAFAQPPAAAPSSVAPHWKDLLEPDAEKAHLAMRHMAAAPGATLAFLREAARPEAAVDAKVIAKLIEELGSSRFADREKAVQELQRLDRHAVEALKKAAQGPVDLETKRRVIALLARQQGLLSGDALRIRRMIEVVEGIGTPEAKQLLEFWGQGASGGRLTQEARQALNRWPAVPDDIAAFNDARVDSLGDPLPAGAVLRLGTTRWRLGDEPIEHGTLQFTPDGRQLLVVDSDAFRILDIRDGKTLSRTPFGMQVHSSHVTPDGKQLVAAGDMSDEKSGTSSAVSVWDLARLVKTAQWKADGRLRGFSPSGAAILEGHDGIREMDIKTGAVAGNHPFPPKANTGGRRQSVGVNKKMVVAVSTSPSELVMYDWSSPQKAKILSIPAARGKEVQHSIVVSPDNKHVAYASSPGVGVHIFDVAAAKEIRHLAPKSSGGVENRFVGGLCFSPDGKSLAFTDWRYDSEGAKDAVIIWDLENHQIRCRTNNGASHLVFSPDSRFLAGWTNSQRILIWDAEAGRELTGGEDSATLMYESRLGFLPNGRGLWQQNQRQLRLYDLPSGRLRAALPHESISALAVSPDSRLVATGSHQHRLRVWDAKTGTMLFQTPGPLFQNLFSVAFSDDGKRVLVWGDDGVQRSWDVKTGRLAGELRPRPKGFPEIPEDDDDSAEQRARRRDVSLELLSIHPAMLSANGSRLIWGFEGISLFDTATAKEVDCIDLDFQPTAIHSTRDAEWLLITNAELGEAVSLYNTRQRSFHGRVATGGENSTSYVAMSPTGHHFAVSRGRPERWIDLYETATLRRRLRITFERGGPTHIAFSPTGRYLATSHSDGTALVYDLRGRP
jgi:WD40 repeat protein